MTIIVTHDYADFDALAALVAAAKIYPESKALLPEGMEPEAALFVEEYGEGLRFTGRNRSTELPPSRSPWLWIPGGKGSSLPFYPFSSARRRSISSITTRRRKMISREMRSAWSRWAQ